jgi:hypothetical protein
MAERDDCLSDILKAIRDRRDRKFVQDHLDELDARAGADDSAGSYREALGRAAEEMLKEEAVKSAIRRRNVRMDALKFRDLRTFVDAAGTAHADGYRMGIEASLVGINVPLFDPKSRRGNQQSAAALGLGAQKDWIGGAVLDMERLGHDDPKMRGLHDLFFSKKIERDWAIERYELTLGDAGRPGRTNNPQALEIAKILQRWDNTRVEALNGEGAWISNYAGYVTKTFHDPDKMRQAAKPKGAFYRGRSENTLLYRGFTEADRAQWAADTVKWLNLKRTFGTAEDADKKLAEMYGGLLTGSHMEMQSYSAEPIIPNVAGQVSASKELHFKDAESWLAYNEKYGRFSPTDGWLYNMRQSANHYGLMKMFGSKPKENYGEVYAYALNKTLGTAAEEDLKKWKFALDNRFGEVSGEAHRPIPNMWSGIVNGVMAVQRWSKLGLTPFAMLQDNVTISRELARQGMGFLDRNGSILSGYLQGAEGSEQRQAAELLHTGILGRLRGVTARFDVNDARAGTMAKLDNWFFKITGITAMTENKRADAERMMANWMGRQREKDWGGLGPEEQRTLTAFGIGDKEWALLKKAEWNRIGEDEIYLTPDVAKKLSDADVQAYLSERMTIGERAQAQAPVTAEAKAAVSAETLDRAREDLALKLWSYYSERGQYAVLEVGPKERAILYQGTQAGSPLNLALRLMLQFKQFPTATVTKAWGAEIYGGKQGLDRVAGLAELIVGSTLFGMMANYLNQTIKGQDPNAQWRNHPAQAVIAGFLRGGAGSIYGDFLLGEWSRHGQQALETLAGPTLGQVNQVFEIWADLTHMKKGAATASLAARMARNNAPYGNMIYTKSAIDYLIYYRFMEWLNPGYLERMERTMKEKSGTEFWLKPTQVAR